MNRKDLINYLYKLLKEKTMKEFAIFILFILLYFGLSAINAPEWLTVGVPVLGVLGYLIYKGRRKK
jgi:1,4-dihydroxy-2-naphthoate octaprenyltransferase